MRSVFIPAAIAFVLSCGLFIWRNELRSSESQQTAQHNVDRDAATIASVAKTNEGEASTPDEQARSGQNESRVAEGALDGSIVEPTESAPSTQLDTFKRTIARIKAQPYDKGWAASAENEITASFLAILRLRQTSPQGIPAELRSVDCRLDACVVTIEWQSFAQASAGWESLLLSPMQPNCDREIVLDESIGPNVPYPTQVAVTNCT